MHCIKSYEVEDIGKKRERNQNMKTKWKDVNSLPGAIYPMVLTTIVRFDESRLRNRAVPKSPTLGSHSELSKTLLADMSLHYWRGAVMIKIWQSMCSAYHDVNSLSPIQFHCFLIIRQQKTSFLSSCNDRSKTWFFCASRIHIASRYFDALCLIILWPHFWNSVNCLTLETDFLNCC